MGEENKGDFSEKKEATRRQSSGRLGRGTELAQEREGQGSCLASRNKMQASTRTRGKGLLPPSRKRKKERTML